MCLALCLVVAQARADQEADTEDGPRLSGGVVAVGQGVGGPGAADGRAQRRLAWRSDLNLSLPGGEPLGAKGQGFVHVRLGRGEGLALRPTFTSTVNSIAFESAEDDRRAVLAQAWYQLDWTTGAKGRVAFTAGKMDLFAFFDQNAVAADESSQFLNNVFVHNPLLDSGGDIAADAKGFAPGLRLAYSQEAGGWRWGLSSGLFASGEAAQFQARPSRPLLIAQAEASPLAADGQARGSWRLYAWTNGNTTDLSGLSQRHAGWGVSVDQRLAERWSLFVRHGQRTRGEGAFDRAMTLGVERDMAAWGRAGDVLALALGRLTTGGTWQALTAADASLAGFDATGAEQLAEVYYRIQVGERVQLSPDLQWIRRPGGHAVAPIIRVLSLRATVAF